MKQILLVAPTPLRFELTQDNIYRNLPLSRVKSFIMPLHLATIAGITPEGFQVTIWDESVLGPIEQGNGKVDYDLVGLTGYTAHLPRAVEVGRFFRERGVKVVIGGAGISSLPHRYSNDFDVLFIGEAEETWPRFLADWQRGEAKKVYRQISPVDLDQTQAPRWDNIREMIPRYMLGAVQTSRGCPFNCDFCDVSYLFGHRFRHKSVERVIAELEALEKLGMRRIVFCDDNFAGNPQYTKKLLREIINLNRRLTWPLGFATEASINIAGDEELLTLLTDANFVEIFVGIESPNKDSLKEANKLQNFRSNLLEDIKRIQSYGMSVRGSLIVGFDHDDQGIFDQHFQFVQQSNLTVPSIRVLMAPPGTRLWKRMRQEGRLVKTEMEGRFYGNPGTTNIIPAKMSRIELMEGYLALIDRVYDWENFAERFKGFISGVRRRPNVPRQFYFWKRLLPFAYFVMTRLDGRSRRIVLDIVGHTIRTAPFMLPRITGFIIRQYGYANRPKLRASIEQLIRQEQSGETIVEIDRQAPPIPDEFLPLYGGIFPEVYQVVSSRMTKPDQMEAALVEIFTEYLHSLQDSAWPGGVTDNPADDIRALANRIIDRRKENEPSSEEKARTLPIISAPDSGHLGDRVLKAVEQELLMADVR